MKRFLTIEFEDKINVSEIKEGDCIAFISLHGYLKCGVVRSAVYSGDLIIEFRVECKGKIFIAEVDRILKYNQKVTGVKAQVIENTTYNF